jgi:hypothetical protein
MNALMVLGTICCALSVILTPGGPFRYARKTLPQIYGEARKGRLRTPLAVQVLGVLGIALTIWGFWRQWFP